MPVMNMPKTSMDYVNAINAANEAGKTQGAAVRTAKFNEIKASAPSVAAAMNKIGQGFIGPVMMRLKYEGIARNVLTEKAIAPGTVPVADVADEMGRAYFLEPYQAEAIISQYEGKRLMYGFRHLAAFATVQEQDFLELTIDMGEYAVNEARQRIQEQEDKYLLAMFDTAIADVTAAAPDFSGQTTHTLAYTSANNRYEPEWFIDAKAKAAENRLDAHNIIMHPADALDLYKWDMVATSVAFRNKTMDGVEVDSFLGFNIFKSVMVERNHAYVMADSDYVGMLPVRKSLEIRNNDKIENFSLGWVLDEFINILVLNAGSLYQVVRY